MATLALIANEALSLLLVIFTYAIPLLSTIRVVHNHDIESYPQWLSYFLIIYILSPILDIFRIHPLFRLILVLWLSLPQFQGALFLYNECLDRILDKYEIQDKVQTKIDSVKESMKNTAWNFAAKIGWNALSQIGEMVSLVQNSASNFAETNTNINSPHKSPIHDDNDHDQDDEHEDDQEDGDILPRRILQKEQSSDSLLLTRKPSHSVMASLSSFSSLDSLSDLVEREMYIADFLAMLKQGLYVFAWSPNPTTTFSTTTTTLEQSDKDSKSFQLRVLFYESATDAAAPHFVLHPVEAHENMSDDDIEIIPISDIHTFRPSDVNGIQFITSEGTTVTAVEVDADAVATTEQMIQSSSETSLEQKDQGEQQQLQQQEPSRKSRTNERIVVEIILANQQDRETILQGFVACFSSFYDDSMEEEDVIDWNAKSNNTPTKTNVSNHQGHDDDNDNNGSGNHDSDSGEEDHDDDDRPGNHDNEDDHHHEETIDDDDDDPDYEEDDGDDDSYENNGTEIVFPSMDIDMDVETRKQLERTQSDEEKEKEEEEKKNDNDHDTTNNNDTGEESVSGLQSYMDLQSLETMDLQSLATMDTRDQGDFRD